MKNFCTPEMIRARVGHIRGAMKQAQSWITEDDHALVALADLVEHFISTMEQPAQRIGPMQLGSTQSEALAKLKGICAR